MEEQERQLVVEQLTSSRDRLRDLTQGLTAEQWTFHPGEGRWSIGECLEHVMRVENRVTNLIAQKLTENAPDPKQNTERISDALLMESILDRSVGRQAPEALRPTGQWQNADEVLTEFEATRQRTTQFVATTQGDLRSYFHPHGAFGELDCYQWLLAISSHGARHAQQIEEIKATADFPK
jgi:hypothetical protein